MSRVQGLGFRFFFVLEAGLGLRIWSRTVESQTERQIGTGSL